MHTRTTTFLLAAACGLLLPAASAFGFGTFGALDTYATGGAVYGVASADMNGDGKADILAGNDPDSTAAGDHVSLLLGKGDGSFKSEQKIKDTRGPEGIAIGRFNGDKLRDFAVADYGNTASSRVSIFLNRGHGKFRLKDKLKTGPGAWLIQAADLDHDGNLDLVTGNYDTDGSDFISVLLGKGGGRFKPHHDYAGSSGQPYGLALAKMDDDNHLDAVTTDSDNNLDVILGKSGGRFGADTPLDMGVGLGYGVDTGKFDNDQNVDAIFPQSGDDKVTNERGDGQGTFSNGLSVAAPDSPNGIAAGDLDRDGNLDAVTGRNVGGFTPIFGTTGDLNPGTPVDGSSPVESIELARLNHDKGLDVVLGTDDGVDVFLNEP